MPTSIINVWTPEIWLRDKNEKLASFPVFMNSPCVVKNAEFDALASGGGISANLPFFKDTSDLNDAVQIEETAPTEVLMTAGKQLVPILNRVTKMGVTALASAVTGENVEEGITSQVAAQQLKQTQKVVISELRGAFGTGSVAIGGAAALQNTRLVRADEAGVGAAALELMSVNTFLDAKALMGEVQSELSQGGFFVHPAVFAGLEKADAANVGVTLPSQLPFMLRTYRGISVYLCDALVRAGTTDGFVYDSYLIAPGSIAWGEKPQATDDGSTIDVAAFQLYADKDKNTEWIFNRRRFLVGINGLRYTATPAASSATNAELAVPGSWTLVYTTANRTGIVAIQTNG
jgi:hypothetical protein